VINKADTPRSLSPPEIIDRVGGSKEDFDRAWGFRPTGPVMEELLVHSPLGIYPLPNDEVFS